jgi:hypothetical protein
VVQHGTAVAAPALSGKAEARQTKVFCCFFSKKATAQVGGTTSPKRRPRGRKQFFFEKKYQKTSPNQGSLYPERPQPKQSKVFCCFFSKKKALFPAF